MNRTVIAFVLVCMAVAAAQQTDKKKTEADAVSPPAQMRNQAVRSTVRGCVVEAANGFALLDPETATQYRLEGDARDLQNHRGQMVEITGEQLPPTTKASGAGFPRLRAQQLRPVDGNCDLSGAAKAGAANTTTTPGTNRPAPSVETPRYSGIGDGRTTPPAGPVNTQGDSGRPSPGSNDPRNTQPPR